MATFRVSIRKPGTRAPVWDYAETVVAATARDAILVAYNNWTHGMDNPPALRVCATQAVQR